MKPTNVRVRLMRVCLLHNRDHEQLDDDPGREAREDVVRVAAALETALVRTGHEVERLPIDGTSMAFVERLGAKPPDLVFNLCESLAADSRGEMAVPCLLDLLGVPYTGSGPLALGLALHKDKAKELLLARGVSTPAFRLVEQLDDLSRLNLPYPLIVKPAREDASVGVELDSVVQTPDGLARAVARVLHVFQQPALVEQFIPGREIYVPLLGNALGHRHPLPLSEIRFGTAFDGKANIVSYRAKWEPSSPEFQDSPSGPCALPPEVHHRVVATAVAAFDALGCRDYGRVDVRLSPDGQPFVIDINPNCDLHPEAGFARAALAAGIDYPTLASRLVDIALERHHGNSTPRPSRPSPSRLPAESNRNVLAGRGSVRPGAHRPRAHAE